MHIKLRFLLALMVLSGSLACYNSYAQIPADRPAFIVGIVVDGMKYDWIERYWNLFGEGGIKKLIKQGTNYTDTSVPFLLADAGSSSASISTGAPPAIHGIVSENWYNRLRREQENCTNDYLARSIGGNSINGKHSANQLLANTIGDQIILSSDYKGKVVSVSFRAEPAILLEGHIPGSAYWFDTPSGNWITSSQYANTLPEWVNNFNARNSAAHYMTRDWDLLLADNLYSGCPPDDNDLETGYYNQFKTFPYKLSRIRRESLGQDNEILGMMPFGNTLTTDFAITALLEEGLGKDQTTDLLWVSYTAINQITKLFGPDSREVADALLRLDMDIQRLLYQIEETIGKDKTLIFLTSTHGSSMDPDYSRALNLPGRFFRYRNAVALLNSYLSVIYGEGNWIEYYVNHQIYLNETLIDQKNLSFTIIQDQASRFLTHFDGVARAIPADRLLTGEVTSPWGDLVQNSYSPDRTGDIFLILQPGWIEEENTDSDSRSPYSYDTHVPLTWYGWKVSKQTINRPVTLLDIAPTLSHVLNISSPAGATGKILYDLVK
ncbi:MAG: alkaline phosphatase family protein [Porphyromonadaceae bacterium]|nr:MAG: alkaline phosphatase family protein [Porphyromonadaceae bacterium]